MFSRTSVLLLFLSVAPFKIAIAEQKDYVLPIFTGEWYISNTSHSADESINNSESYFNQCFTEEFVFKKKSADKEGAVLEYMNSLPSINNCTWKIREIYEHKSYQPETYLTSDWDEVQNKVYETTYYLNCMAVQDGYENYYDGAYIEIRPIYTCPENTRISYGIYGNHCSYKANLCLADVVGRDMNSDYFYWLGHVGLTDSSFYYDDANMVLEVLKPNKHEDAIQENPFKTFAHSSSSFWGSVYEYHSDPKLTFMQSIDILNAGKYQSEFGAIYVPFAEYREGGVVPKTIFDYFAQKKNRKEAIQKAAFRCDTFVQYCYYKGANIYLKELSPKFMFNSFKKYRKALPVDFLISPSQDYAFSKEVECDSTQCFEEKISQLIKEKAKSEDVLFVIDNYKQYLSNNELFNQYLINIFKDEIDSRREIADHLLDLLVLGKPSDSIRVKLVDLYLKRRVKPSAISLKLLSTFGELFVYDDSEVQEFSTEQIQLINKANEIVIDILKNSNNLMEVVEASNVALQIMDNSHAEPLIFDAIKRFPSISNEEKNKVLERVLFYQIANNSDLMDLNSIRSHDFNKRLLLLLKYDTRIKIDKKNKTKILNYTKKMDYRNNLPQNLRSALPQNLGDRLLWLSVIKKLGGHAMEEESLNSYDSYTKKMLIKSMYK